MREEPKRVDRGHRKREIAARVLGVVAALACMAIATGVLGWPAPGISAAIGFGLYLVARPARR